MVDVRQQHGFERAKQIRLDFGENVLVFAFRDSQGELWEGCLDEWLGNDNFHGSDALEYPEDGRCYMAVGSSGGGADLVLVRDDGIVCYLNDNDLRISEVAGSVDEFVTLLHKPP